MRIVVDIAAQRLRLEDAPGGGREWPVSTARNGSGETMDSGCTPRGRHRVRARIGAGAPLHAVFVGRRPTGEIWTPELARAQPKRDWILSRILWLGGCEPGFNRYGRVDSAWRYIYIHGTPPDQVLGEPHSHGCIRMAGQDVISLFDLTPAGTEVLIHD
jgi:L,D-transpeptidase YbiS